MVAKGRCNAALSFLPQQFRQFGDIRRDPARTATLSATFAQDNRLRRGQRQHTISEKRR